VAPRKKPTATAAEGGVQLQLQLQLQLRHIPKSGVDVVDHGVERTELNCNATRRLHEKNPTTTASATEGLILAM
jgi:hypothetical protein